ncbi:MAG: FKBP-type peptidyl-prolyl cis-trans isomerase [Proteobacteria bacterium]|nr:FKBP-type peptidyl-prolyl cis-trans isomerase [Pseudomonadota bacterium]
MKTKTITTVARIATPGLLAVLVASAAYAQDNDKESKVVKEGSKVSIEYTLKLDDGSTADSSEGRDPMVYTQGGNEILPALEAALAGLAEGESKQVKLSASDGYGEIDEEAFRQVELAQIPEEAREAGTMLVVGAPDGSRRPVRVVEIKDETAVIDFNHPLAGKDLTFDVKIVGVE